MREVRDLSHARRWGVARQIHPQSVADHSFFVALYSGEIARIVSYPTLYLGELLRYAIWHDMPETWTTDLPGPCKRSFCDPVKLAKYERDGMIARFGDEVPLAPPNDYAKAICKLADMMDELLFLISEQRLGNTNLRRLRPCSEKRLGDSLQVMHKFTDQMTWEKLALWVADILVAEEYGDSMEPK